MPLSVVEMGCVKQGGGFNREANLIRARQEYVNVNETRFVRLGRRC